MTTEALVWCLTCIDIYSEAKAMPGFINPDAEGFDLSPDHDSGTVLCGRCRRVMLLDGRSLSTLPNGAARVFIFTVASNDSIKLYRRRGEWYAIRSELYAQLIGRFPLDAEQVKRHSERLKQEAWVKSVIARQSQ